MNAPVSLKALAESKADGIQKATTFKVRPDAVEFEVGFNLRDEGPELDAHIDQLEAANVEWENAKALNDSAQAEAARTANLKAQADRQVRDAERALLSALSPRFHSEF